MLGDISRPLVLVLGPGDKVVFSAGLVLVVPGDTTRRCLGKDFSADCEKFLFLGFAVSFNVFSVETFCICVCLGASSLTALSFGFATSLKIFDSFAAGSFFF